ncbi:DUF982 domain-containing protein [Thioclava sp. BHET1]|nr:DUF982 domain-containing protein [Thioclava sp. BHET1]
MELNWGHPMMLSASKEDEILRVSTIEQAHYYLKRKWPTADDARDFALSQIEAAMNCLVSVSSARRAFLSAADSAGYSPTPPKQIH